jgi:hypothetical protein
MKVEDQESVASYSQPPTSWNLYRSRNSVESLRTNCWLLRDLNDHMIVEVVERGRESAATTAQYQAARHQLASGSEFSRHEVKKLEISGEQRYISTQRQ